MAWQDRGACRGADPDLFFPTKNRTAHAAKRICAVCEVRAECLAYAIDNEPLGVWGGMSPRERRTLRKQRRAATA
ncbi:MAG: WhiB family transcriptional regulator [Microthrixaceae bacterium]|nr:WhiB family transcriptional regulator [Microthrixaceae bacterium]